MILTDEEINSCWHDTPWTEDLKVRVFDFAERIEAKVLERLQGNLKSRYLLNGRRFKLSYQSIECDDCGSESPYMLVTPLDMFEKELDQQWVALVPAEDDCHLQLLEKK